MTNEEAINGLKSLEEVRRKYGDMQTMKDEIECLDMAIKALEQEPCEDCISRQAVLNSLIDNTSLEGYDLAEAFDAIENTEKLPPVTPQPKIGRWTLIQRGKYIDINCSECSNTRIKSYSYGYTIDELNLDNINNLIAETQMNYCECCGAKMEEPQESEVKKCQ